MSGIYGNSPEDRYFENRLLDHLNESEVSGKITNREMNFFSGDFEYSVEFSAEIRNGEVTDLVIHFASKATETDEDFTEIPGSEFGELYEKMRGIELRIVEEFEEGI